MHYLPTYFRFYTGTAIDSPFTQHVFYYNLNTDVDTCITCTFASLDGACLFASASFSTDYSYFAEMCYGPGPNYISINAIDNLVCY